MAACAGTTRKGSACTMPAARGSKYCYQHHPDPAVANRRKRNVSIALCSDIGPMLLPTSGGGMSGTPKLIALCLKQTSEGWSNFIDYRSRVATLGNSRIGAEIRSTRLLVRELLDLTLSNDLHPLIRKRLTEVVQLLQVYCPLSELELAAGEKPTSGDIALPEDAEERIREWAGVEEAKVRERERLVEDLSQAMEAQGHDPTPIREVMGG